MKASTYYGGLYLYRGDLLRQEVADRTGAFALAKRLWPQVATAGSKRVIFYRAGSRQWGGAAGAGDVDSATD